jgi:hypothetical protein
MPPLSIKTFYEETACVEAEGREIVPAVTLPPLPPEHMPALERLIEWGKERKHLSDLMSSAEAGSDNSDAVLGAITRMFPVKNSTRRVQVPQELVDRYADGNVRELTFGVQDIHSPEQWDHLEKQAEGMRKYFPDIALYGVVDSRTGKKTALVMGIEANAFNALAKAERKKQQLNAAVRQACKDLDVPEAWVDRKIEQNDGNSTKPPGKAPKQLPKKAPGRRHG